MTVAIFIKEVTLTVFRLGYISHPKCFVQVYVFKCQILNLDLKKVYSYFLKNLKKMNLKKFPAYLPTP